MSCLLLPQTGSRAGLRQRLRSAMMVATSAEFWNLFTSGHASGPSPCFEAGAYFLPHCERAIGWILC